MRLREWLALVVVPIAVAIAIIVAATAYADAVPDSRKQPRTLGQRAVMHVYYYAPATLEITYVDTYLFKDEASCQAAAAKAGLIAVPYADAGDLVNVQCVAMRPPPSPQPEPPAPSTQS